MYLYIFIKVQSDFCVIHCSNCLSHTRCSVAAITTAVFFTCPSNFIIHFYFTGPFNNRN